MVWSLYLCFLFSLGLQCDCCENIFAIAPLLFSLSMWSSVVFLLFVAYFKLLSYVGICIKDWQCSNILICLNKMCLLVTVTSLPLSPGYYGPLQVITSNIGNGLMTCR